MASVLDIFRGISQAAANAYDGSHDPELVAPTDGDPKKVGLKREEGNHNIEARIMDGFKVKFSGDKLCVHYHGETRLKDLHQPNKFEGEIEQMLADIVKYLKKEYKKVTGKSLNLNSEGEPHIDVQHISRIRTQVQAYQWFKIGGLSDVNAGGTELLEPSEMRLDKAVKNWLSLGKNDVPY